MERNNARRADGRIVPLGRAALRSGRWPTPRVEVSRLNGERREAQAAHWSGMSDDKHNPSALPPTLPLESLTLAAGTTRPPLLLKLDAAAAELQCTRRSLERQIAAGRITAIHIGRSVRIERRELEAFIELLREEAESEAPPRATASRDRDWAIPVVERGEVHGQTA